MPNQQPYPSDLTDAEWELLRPLLPGLGKLGRPPRYDRRKVLEAIFYVVRSGCAWRLLPHDLPPYRPINGVGGWAREGAPGPPLRNL